MFNKEFIRDNGKIRHCTSNVAKMNILEYIWFDIFTENFFKYALMTVCENAVEVLKNLGYLLINITGVVLFPITLIIKAHYAIKRNRKEMGKRK